MEATNVIYILIIAVSALFAGILAWFTRQTMIYNALVTIQMDYRSHQMGYAVDRLWRFYREECDCDKNTLKEKYYECYKKDQKKVDNTEEDDMQIKARETTLDNQRRVVSHFYNHLAVLYVNGILPPKYIFETFSKDTLMIIPCILIPMENKLRAYIKQERDNNCKNTKCDNWELTDLPFLEKDSNLCRLFIGSENYKNKLDKKYLCIISWIAYITAWIFYIYVAFWINVLME